MLPVEMEDHELTDFETLVQNLTPGDLRALAHIPPGWHDRAAIARSITERVAQV